MRHRAKNGDWAERKRVWRHPLLGESLHHVIMGFISEPPFVGESDWSEA